MEVENGRDDWTFSNATGKYKNDIFIVGKICSEFFIDILRGFY